MRIIHLINHCRLGHGNVHAAIDLACAQVKQGDEVWVASGDGEFTSLLAECGVRHIILDQENRGILDISRMIYKLYRSTTEIKPHLFHAHMMTGAVIGFIVSRLRGVKLVTTVHNAFDSHSIIMALGDRVIAVSAAVSAILLSRGIPARRVRVVLNGTLGAPRRDFFPVQEMTLERPNITTICGLHDRKGVKDLILAFSLVGHENREVHLYIAGEGPSRKTYEAFAKTMPQSDRIHFLGTVRDTKTLLRASDIFVLASHADPMPLVLSEAREAGCAIIATNVDGIPEALESGKAGVLVPPKRPDAIAEAIINLLKNENIMDKYRTAAKTGLQYWTTIRVAEDTRSIYLEIVGSR